MDICEALPDQIQRGIEKLSARAGRVLVGVEFDNALIARLLSRYIAFHCPNIRAFEVTLHLRLVPRNQ